MEHWFVKLSQKPKLGVVTSPPPKNFETRICVPHIKLFCLNYTGSAS